MILNLNNARQLFDAARLALVNSQRDPARAVEWMQTRRQLIERARQALHEPLTIVAKAQS